MIIPNKTYTDNPFVDNVIYYSKLIAMNCTVKDEEEALLNETKDTLEDGDILISCIEGNTSYELFKSIPKEILEKYIPVESNLDLYVNDVKSLLIHINSYGVYEQNKIYDNLSRIAREVYIDHYEIMINYLDTVGLDWADVNRDLYNKCINGNATYIDLFSIMPLETRKRIIKQYLNNFDISKLDTISSTLNNFSKYINTRSDMQIEAELNNISKAMRDVFISHYNMMIERRYVKESNEKWLTFIDLIDAYNHCKNNTATYSELYNLFPQEELINSLNFVFGNNIVSRYGLNTGLDILDQYFTISANSATEKNRLNAIMIEKYLNNYNSYIDFSTYGACQSETLGYIDLIDHIPKETLKMILNTQIPEITNLEVYENNKKMLNSYLQTLPEGERNIIKENINKDMKKWYPSHHKEYNNYYRSLIGLPPVDSNNNQYEDTLLRSYDATTNTYINFGDRFIKQLPTGIYPEIHWKQNLCDFDSYDIGILNQYGILDEYVNACGKSISSPRYRYLRYLGDNKLDLYQCRKALKFQLIGIPTIDDTDAKKRFTDCYAINRDYVLRTVYSDAHKFQSDYYDKFIIIFIIVNTIMDMLSNITEMIIDREVFDSRCIKWLFESFGVPYYSEIPIKYLRAMLKNLNTLLKYKSSTKNMIDICNLFGFSDVRVFGYYLFRERSKDPNSGKYIFPENATIDYDINLLWVKDINGETIDCNGIRYTRLLEYKNYNEEDYLTTISYIDTDNTIKTKNVIKNNASVYIKNPIDNEFMSLQDTKYFSAIKADTSAAELKFIKVPIDDELTEYKNDPNYIIPYDEITYNDEGDTWDGGLNHDKLYKDLVDYEFNAVKTKYVSVETITDLTEQSFQVSYFYNMIFDNLYSEEALTVKVPYIKIGHDFRFMDIICYLFALMYFYNDLEDNIMYSPTQILYIKGYNFNEALNAVFNDSNAFTQEHDLSERENIFDINERISEDDYDYHDAFNGYNIKSFNLEADIDELDRWLYDNYYMNLSDFVVDDTLTNFSQIITLKQFFSLNNSYYQKNIFQDAVAPLPYNQSIKSAYDMKLFEKNIIYDLDDQPHKYIRDLGNKLFEVFDDISDEIYVMDYTTYIIKDQERHSILNKYTRNTAGSYKKETMHYYYFDNKTYKIERVFDDLIYIVNKDGKYIFATNAVYAKNPVTGEYYEITDDKYFITDKYESDRKRLMFGEYWVQDPNGNWVIDPEQAYVWVEVNGSGSFKQWNDVNSHENITVTEDKCWIKHSDGHFVKYTETDYYITGHGANEELYTDGDNKIYNFKEELCYVESTTMTDESDTDPNGVTRYFKKLSDYYYENNWVYTENIYVYDPVSDSYIPESNLISPANCYYRISSNVYALVIDNCASYYNYEKTDVCSYILVRQADNNYTRHSLDKNGNYIINNITKTYVYDSDSNYIIGLIPDSAYDQTKMMVVVFNQDINMDNVYNLDPDTKYNPERTDKIWDENDWVYTGNSSSSEDIGMHGENIWYYRKPGNDNTVYEEDAEIEPIGSGFIMESSAYIGNVHLVKGEKYYMAFDIETNFTGTIQIYNTADSGVNGINDRVYEVVRREKQHITQVFIANEDQTPEIRFLKYDFEKYPIYAGDYIIISNIKFIRAHSDNFIAQDIPSYDKLQEIYKTNEAIYKYLIKLMAEETDFDKYQIYKKLYDSLMVSKYNKEAFKLGDNKYARTYTEFLENRDSILYSKLTRFKSLDPGTMHKEIADEIIEVTYAIDGCVDTYTYGFLYSYFPAVSASYIQQYITKLINWFKSWKVHLLGINTVYKLGDMFENTVKVLEKKNQGNTNRYDGDVYIHHTVKINPLDDINISGEKYYDLYDIDEFTHNYNDNVNIKDRVRIISRYGNRITYNDSENEIHLEFNNDEITATVGPNNNLKISSSNAGFNTADVNDLIMTTDEDEQQLFAHQVIDEINRFSSDFIEWRNLLNE